MKKEKTVKYFHGNFCCHFQFRVALIISSMELHSEQSLIISTLAQGSPLSKPEIVRAVAVDDTRISISWESGPFTNGPILFYVLQIKESYYDNLISVQVQEFFIFN